MQYLKMKRLQQEIEEAQRQADEERGIVFDPMPPLPENEEIEQESMRVDLAQDLISTISILQKRAGELANLCGTSNYTELHAVTKMVMSIVDEKDSEEFIKKLTLSVDDLQGKIDDLAEKARASGADIHKINGIRYRSLASGK